MTCDPRPTWFLVGFMGVGKTSVARTLATRLERPLFDTDAHIVEREGRSIDRIFAESGEGYFRAVEQDVLESEVPYPLRPIVATGGGLFLGRAQRAFVRRRGRSLWLDAPLEVLRARVGDGVGRPLWATDEPLEAREVFERRRATYALADLRVDAGEGDVERVAARALERMARFEPETRFH